MPLSHAVVQFTNFCRRFGLGRPRDAVLSPAWKRYAETLDGLASHDARVRWTQDVFRRSPRETLPPGQKRFGCFSVDPPDESGVVRIHFGNHDRDGTSPLAPAKIAKRRRELTRMFGWMRATHPGACEVRGTSWLYDRESYRRLFPLEYVAAREVLRRTPSLQGSSRWGQFLDARGAVKADLRDRFRDNLKSFEMDRMWAVFPLPTYSVRAPIEVFYRFYLSAQRL